MTNFLFGTIGLFAVLFIILIVKIKKIAKKFD